MITGTGTYSLPWLEHADRVEVETPFGTAAASVGSSGSVDVVHIARHEAGHARLSNHVQHRANVAALEQLGVPCVVATTICGAVDPDVAIGSFVVFDDLYFPSNRLADGSLCTLYPTPEATRPGHWIFGRPYADSLRSVLTAAASAAGYAARDSGVYGHTDGPRFESRAEIRMLASAGVTAVSQTAGPETVLAGEAALPYALAGFVVNHANGVGREPTAAATLERLLGESKKAVAAVLAEAVSRLAEVTPEPSGLVYRFGG